MTEHDWDQIDKAYEMVQDWLNRQLDPLALPIMITQTDLAKLTGAFMKLYLETEKYRL